MFGANISGPEYGPSQWEQAAPWPTSSDWNYLDAKGVTFIRLAVAWESLQSTLNSSLNSAFVAGLKATIAGFNSVGIDTIVDIHNYGCHCNSTLWATAAYAGNGGAIISGVNYFGDGTLTTAAFGNFWGQLAQALSGTAGLIGYDLMTNPGPWNGDGVHTNLTVAGLAAYYQAAISAIRTYDTTTRIYMMLPATFGAANFSTLFADIADPANNYAPDWHVYFDVSPDGNAIGPGTYSGNYASYSQTPQGGVTQLAPYVQYCQSAGFTGSNAGLVGEFGWPNDYSSGYLGGSPNQWEVLGTNALNYLVANYLIGACWQYNSLARYQNGSGGALAVNPVSGVDDIRFMFVLMQATFAPVTTFFRPYLPTSPWNAVPQGVTLSGIQLYLYNENDPYPADVPYIIVAASADDPAYTFPDTGVHDQYPGPNTFENLVINHWPPGVEPPGSGPGSDSYVDVYDPTDGMIHDCYQVTLVSTDPNVYTMTGYACEPIRGTGFATPSKPSSGARAAGNSAMGGLYTLNEINCLLKLIAITGSAANAIAAMLANNGLCPIQHALGLETNGGNNSVSNGNIYPSIGEDFGSGPPGSGSYTGTFATGAIPMGINCMIPADFDMTQFNSPLGLARALALQKYGSYFNDTSVDTFSLSATADAIAVLFDNGVETDNGILLMNDYTDWFLTRDSLQAMTGVTGWIDGCGNVMEPDTVGYNNLPGPGQFTWEGQDLLRMGPPYYTAGVTPPAFGNYSTQLFEGIGGYFDTGSTSTPNTAAVCIIGANVLIPPLIGPPPDYEWWFFWNDGEAVYNPVPGRTYTFKCMGTGVLTLTIGIFAGNTEIETFDMAPGDTVTFEWPSYLTNEYSDGTGAAPWSIGVQVNNNSGAGGTIKATMI